MDCCEHPRLLPPVQLLDTASTVSSWSETTSVSDFSLEPTSSPAYTIYSDPLPEQRFKLGKLLDNIEQVHTDIQAKFDTFTSVLRQVETNASAHTFALNQLEKSYATLEQTTAKLRNSVEKLQSKPQEEKETTTETTTPLLRPIVYSDEYLHLLHSKQHSNHEIRLSYTTTLVVVLITFFIAFIYRPNTS